MSLRETMFVFLRSIYRKIVPSNIRDKWWQNAHKKKLYKYYLYFIRYIKKAGINLTDEDDSLISLIRQNPYIRTYDKGLLQKLIFIILLENEVDKDDEKLQILNYLKENDATMIPYDFIKKYKAEDINVYDNKDYKYVLHENKRMYFPQNWEDERIQLYYNNLIQEQDIDSPHRYEYNNFQVNSGDVVVDIGAAEGIFALSIVEKAKKVYLFECNDIWVDVLKMTFLPYKDKIIIVNKYVGDMSEEDGGINTVTIDQFFDGKEVNFIKADVEGAEINILKGAINFLKKAKNIKMTLCTYHNENDAKDIKQILLQYNFHLEFSKGYLLSIWEGKYRLRKGIIRGFK